jgi:hypothetical protein
VINPEALEYIKYLNRIVISPEVLEHKHEQQNAVNPEVLELKIPTTECDQSIGIREKNTYK